MKKQEFSEIVDGETISDFSGQDREAVLFRGCTFIDSNLKEARLIDCVFERCTFSSVKLDHAVLQVSFVECKVEGVNFFVAQRTLISLTFKDCLIRFSSFATLKLPGVAFTGCTLKNVDFAEANIPGANFSKTEMEDCIFQSTNLSKADFRGARGYALDPRLNKLIGAHFEMPEVVSLLDVFQLDIEP